MELDSPSIDLIMDACAELALCAQSFCNEHLQGMKLKDSELLILTEECSSPDYKIARNNLCEVLRKVSTTNIDT